MKTFVEKFIKETSLTELDLDYPYYDDTEGEVKNDVLVQESALNYVERGVPSMDIDDVIVALNELKRAGANRVYIADHSGHHGYYFYGMELKEI